MTDLDARLRSRARSALDRYGADVPVDEDLAAVLGRSDVRSLDAGRRRLPVPRLLVAAAIALLVAGTVAVLALRDDDADLVDAPVPPTQPATSSPSDTAPPTVAAVPSLAVADPPVAERGWTIAVSPVGTVVRTCLDIVHVARFEEGEPIEVGRVLPDGTWDDAVPGTVPPCLGEETDAPLDVRVPEQLADGDHRFCIAGVSVPEGCAVVTIAATVTTTNEANTEATTVVERAVLGRDLLVPPGFFARRSIQPSPYFEIRSLGPDGADLGTLTADEVDQLLGRETVVDDRGGTVALLPEDVPYGRCDNRTPATSATNPDAVPDASAIPDARSIGGTIDGIVIVGVDVCPGSTRWGDAGTSFELQRVDLNDPRADPTVLVRREADPTQVLFDDGTVVYATHELIVESVSSDGRFVAVAEPYTSEDTRYHLIDAVAGGDPIGFGSRCAEPGDLVGPPRFVDDGLVVVARECSPSRFELGQLVVELVSLTELEPVWSVEVQGVAINSHDRRVQLSARMIDGEVWALVSASAGVEQPVTVSVVRARLEQPLDLPGYDSFAFTPAELIAPWDPAPG